MKLISVNTLLKREKVQNIKQHEPSYLSFQEASEDQLAEAAEVSAQKEALRRAGFTTTEKPRPEGCTLKLLRYLCQHHPEGLYREAEIKSVAIAHGLKKLSAQYYQGVHQETFAADIVNYQQELAQAELDAYVHFSKYFLLGSMATLSGYRHQRRYAPLVFAHVYQDLYYLVSQYESMIPAMRQYVYWPFRSYGHTTITMGCLLPLIFLLPSPLLLLGLPLFFMSVWVAIMITLTREGWTSPTALYPWVQKLLYRLFPW